MRLNLFGAALIALMALKSSANAGSLSGQLVISDLNTTVDLGAFIPWSAYVSADIHDNYPGPLLDLTWENNFYITGGLMIQDALGTSVDQGLLFNAASNNGYVIPAIVGYNIPVLEQILEVQSACFTDGRPCQSVSFLQFAYPTQIGTISVVDNPGSNSNNPIGVSPLGHTRFQASLGCASISGLSAGCSTLNELGQIGATSPGSAITTFSSSDSVANPIYIDPTYASGYEFSVDSGSPAFASIILPAKADPYTIDFNNTDITGVLGGVTYQFPLGVSDFIVGGIDPSTPFDTSDPNFVYGLTFYTSAPDIRDTNTVVDMTALLSNTEVPEPATLALLGTGVLGVGAIRRKRPRRSNITP